MDGLPVNADNFARAESDRMFAAVQQDARAVNRWLHYRVPTPLDRQTVIRMNRDTLYSAAVVDISAGATSLPPSACPADVAAVNALQDRFGLQASSGEPFVMPAYDRASFDATRTALLELARGVDSLSRAFGSKDSVNAVHHLLANRGRVGRPP
jgi:hypothetical protein